VAAVRQHTEELLVAAVVSVMSLATFGVGVLIWWSVTQDLLSPWWLLTVPVAGFAGGWEGWCAFDLAREAIDS
jgi:hypothetical protein